MHPFFILRDFKGFYPLFRPTWHFFNPLFLSRLSLYFAPLLILDPEFAHPYFWVHLICGVPTNKGGRKDTTRLCPFVGKYRPCTVLPQEAGACILLLARALLKNASCVAGLPYPRDRARGRREQQEVSTHGRALVQGGGSGRRARLTCSVGKPTPTTARLTWLEPGWCRTRGR